jgi:hypothetical protein
LKNKKSIIAKCIAQAGYGTSSYDRKTGECEHECYAYITKIISNPEYWEQYSGMSQKLNQDFHLGFNFAHYELTVHANGEQTAVKLDKLV